MKAVVQRVTSARVIVNHEVVGSIDGGLLVLVGLAPSDTHNTLDWLVKKLTGLRIFTDEQGKMNLSVQDIAGGILAVSQFTLYGNAQKGRRPSFGEAAPPDIAEPLFETFMEKLNAAHPNVASGVFGASMEVELTNSGPVTILLER